MMVSCEHFQNIEEAHIKQIKIFLSNYAHVLENGHALIGQVYVEFVEQCNEMDVNKLLEYLVNEKEAQDLRSQGLLSLKKLTCPRPGAVQLS
ncbi:FCH domain only protein 2 [Caerostris extrusa]|uniref:FCH domain only protein 2 n=1 Tax=Caerostris extrusa TaxID=172846 RepID=A0AAV4TZ97_CAEEX|nr:FCH domain only protein 2 [Caerostris extrusa]